MNPEFMQLVKKFAIDAGMRKGRLLDKTMDLFKTYTETEASADPAESLRYLKNGDFIHIRPLNVFLKPKDLVYEAARIYCDVTGIQTAVPPFNWLLIIKILIDIVATGKKLQSNILTGHEAQVLWAVYYLTVEDKELSEMNLDSLLSGMLSQDEINQAIANLEKMEILIRKAGWDINNALVLKDYFIT